MSDNLINRKAVLLAVFFSSTAVLLFEMAQIRIFSYSLPAILSYIGISLAMLGFGIGAMLLSMVPGLGASRPRATLAVLLILQAISMVVASMLFAAVAWDTVINMQRGFIPIIIKILLPCTIPYFFAGLFLAIIFSSAKESIGKLYFWNLLGAGLGALLITVILRPLGAEKIIFLSALLTCLAVVLISQAYHRLLTGLAVILIIAFAILLPYSSSLLKFTPRPDDGTGYLQLVTAQKKGLGGEITNEFSEWNIVGRIDIWSQDDTTLRVPEELDYRLVTVDSGAATLIMADPGTKNWGRELFEETFYGLAYHAKPSPESVAVIGPGGGTDVQTALYWGADKINGIEINSTTISAVTGPYADFLKWPLSDKVSLIHEDGRSYLKSTRGKYDVIQMSGIDTLTINSTGAFNMVEESLFTVEAFEDIISALKPDGVFAVVRFIDTDVRYATVAAEALLRLGVADPQQHIATFRQGWLIAAVLVSRSPFTGEQLDSLQRIADRTDPNTVFIPPFDVLDAHTNVPITIKYLPGRITSPEYVDLFDAMNAGIEQRKKRLASAAIATDDKPFDVIGGFLHGAIKLPVKNNFRLFKLFWVGIVILAFVLIMLPVVVFGKKTIGSPALFWVLGYFALIGLSFMMLEINMINRFTIFIGTPGASIAVVLTSILVASGIGSYVSSIGTWMPQQKIAFATLLLVIAALALKYISPTVFNACYAAGASQEIRGLIAGLMLLPLGFCMGWFFPNGLRVIDTRFSGAHLVPWAIAINGFMSVVGSVIALPITLWYGFNNLFWLSVFGYILTGLLAFIFIRKPGTF